MTPTPRRRSLRQNERRTTHEANANLATGLAWRLRRLVGVVSRPGTDEDQEVRDVLTNPSSRTIYGSARDFRVLALVESILAAFPLLFSAFPPVTPSPRGADLALGLGLLGVGALTLTMGRRAESWSLETSMLSAGLLLAIVVVIRRTDIGQVLGGMSFMLLAVFAAYSRPPKRAAPLVLVVMSMYAAALLIRQDMPGPQFYIIAFIDVMGVMMIVSQLVRRLRVQAMLDPLTHVLNRRALEHYADGALALCRRQSLPAAVGLVDIDQFKRYNDVHGHAEADEKLVELCGSWLTQLRATDVVARIGGDEFAFVLPGSTLEDARRLRERLDEVGALPCTFGFAAVEDGDDVWSALERADAEMYQRKSGRDGAAP